MVVKTTTFPAPGQTVLGGQFFMFPGGKGANQAVAAVRLGANTTLITKLGRDIFGDKSFDGFNKAGIDCRYIQWDNKNPSGIALITINEKGENHIVVAPGANNTLLPIDLDRAELAFLQADLMLMQLEIPVETVRYAASKAAALRKKIILNPAPAMALPDELFATLYLITPNETEAAYFTGVEVHDIETARKSAEILLRKGVQNVVITMGAQGAFFKNASEEMMIPSPQVEAVDTTAAGDVFNGALSVALLEHMPWKEALTWACRAAAYSVTRMGAQSSAPDKQQLVSWQLTVDS